MSEIILRDNRAYRWYKSSQWMCRGYIWHNEKLYRGEELLNLLSEVSVNEIESLLQSISGMFVMVYRDENRTILISDYIRSFPLFYYRDSGMTLISDTSSHIKEKYDLEIVGKDDLRKFEAMGFTLGKQTLLQNVFQTRPCEIVEIGENDIDTRFYFNDVPRRSDDKQLLKNDMLKLFEQTKDKLSALTEKNKVALPLSGGYDSRLIAVFLKEIGCENVLCYSYGRPDNNESILSRQVADILDYEWVFIDYEKETAEFNIQDGDFQEYRHYISNDSSQFFFQEYFAVKRLKADKYIDEDTLFIPGHCGDVIAGGNLDSGLKPPGNMRQWNLQLLMQKMVNLHLSADLRKTLKADIASILTDFGNSKNHLGFEDFDWREKQSKFTVNSARVYSFFGFQYLLPMWDREWIEFFRSLPFKYKYGKQLYNEVLQEKFDQYALNFEPELQVSLQDRFIQEVKDRIKRLLKPLIPIYKLQSGLAEGDAHCYSEATNAMINEMEHSNYKIDRSTRLYNSIITQWMIYKYKSENN